MTYKELIEKFELFANSQVDISRFKCDTLDRMDNFSNESERFPLFYVAPINSVQNFYNTNYKSISYSFRAFFLVPRIDLENTKLDNNINLNQTTTNLNQCEMIMRHFTLFLDNNFDDISFSSIPANGITVDYLQGWILDFNIELPADECFVL